MYAKRYVREYILSCIQINKGAPGPLHMQKLRKTASEHVKFNTLSLQRRTTYLPWHSGPYEVVSSRATFITTPFGNEEPISVFEMFGSWSASDLPYIERPAYVLEIGRSNTDKACIKWAIHHARQPETSWNRDCARIDNSEGNVFQAEDKPRFWADHLKVSVCLDNIVLVSSSPRSIDIGSRAKTHTTQAVMKTSGGVYSFLTKYVWFAK